MSVKSNFKVRKGVLFATASLLAILPQTAHAQDVAVQSQRASDQSTGPELSDIIVTAQKRSQNLQDVPLAVSAISADTLKSKGITDTTSLMGMLPSLQVTSPYGKTQPNFSLRGVSVANWTCNGFVPVT